MKITRFLCFSVLYLLLSTFAFPQGSLTPAGAPNPTMKTLDQVQPRTPIDTAHTPGNGTSQFVISSGGSYYLTANIGGVSGKNGIAITADNVTVDLNGFSIVGVGGSLKGIVVSGLHQNLAISNGIARGWGGSGVDAGNATNGQFTALLVSNNTVDGLIVGSNTVVRGVVASSNGSNGIHVVGTNSRIEDNNCNSNTGAGVKVDASGSLVIKNNAASNGATDYDIFSGSSYGQLVQVPGAGFTNATAWANFSSSCPPGQANCAGICANLTNDTNNCGACGNSCGSPPNVLDVACSSSTCAITACVPNYANCDGNYNNGCEVNINTDKNNCGQCGHVCPGAQICNNGVCQ